MALRQDIPLSLWRDEPVAWSASAGPVPYPEALERMEDSVAAIAAGRAREQVWLLEHPPIYTAGTSAKPEDLVDATRFPVFETGRGGQYTYHGPGQRIAYVMLNLARRGGDVRAFVAGLEQWLIATLAEFGIAGERREDRVGIWVRHGGGEDKIAALGIRVRRGISFHGVSLNVRPDLSHFSGIVPCGVSDHGVTSMAALGVNAAMADVDAALQKHFAGIFAPVIQLS
ncbi:MAG: lipoyl(octanoyl) transferase LipB [Alphaproteobacteria bacterium]|nr:lipoyl(octanoyl) transferase LipB [Alphaproteobacteria bacterium]